MNAVLAKKSTDCGSGVAGRRVLRSTASVFGLLAGALAWSNTAQALSEDREQQVVLLPENYHLQEDGTVIILLHSGESISLNKDQYVILEGGLLLIADELAQNAMVQMPVIGALRTELFADIQPVRTADGAIVEASDTQPLWSNESSAPRLFEEIDIQRYELAQADPDSQQGGNGPNAGGVAAGSLSIAGLSLGLGPLGQEETEEEAEEAASATSGGAAQPPAPINLWTDAMVADSAATTITGNSDDSFLGYTAASVGAATDALSSLGLGATATINMSAGGNNYLVAGDSAAASGSLTYTGGSGNDTLVFGNGLAAAGTATFNMSNAGANSLNAGTGAAATGGISITQAGPGPTT